MYPLVSAWGSAVLGMLGLLLGLGSGTPLLMLAGRTPLAATAEYVSPATYAVSAPVLVGIGTLLGLLLLRRPAWQPLILGHRSAPLVAAMVASCGVGFYAGTFVNLKYTSPVSATDAERLQISVIRLASEMVLAPFASSVIVVCVFSVRQGLLALATFAVGYEACFAIASRVSEQVTNTLAYDADHAWIVVVIALGALALAARLMLLRTRLRVLGLGW